jgi:hypothetical protein
MTRDEWRANQGGGCHWPGCKAHWRKGDILEVHEIIGGASRAKTVTMPSMWLFLCRYHHNQLGSRPNQESLATQLAVKVLADPENFSGTEVFKVWRPKGTDSLFADFMAQTVIACARLLRESQR